MSMAFETIGLGDEAVHFMVARFDIVSGRARWIYMIADANGAVLDTGNDLSTPHNASAEAAMSSLLSFAHADADPHSGAGRLLNFAAHSACEQILPDLELAVAE